MKECIISPLKLPLNEGKCGVWYSPEASISPLNKNLFPLLKVLNTQNITEVVWGAEPDYKKSLKKYKKEINNSIDLRFSRKNFRNEKYALSTLHYEDKESGDAFEVAFKSRHRNNDYINIRKLWKMLDF